jgi:hypothetical protein
MARSSPAISPALHPDKRLLAESGRTVLRGNTEKRIRRGTFHSVAELERAVLDYIRTRNNSPRPFSWVTKASTILAKVRRASPVISEAGH